MRILGLESRRVDRLTFNGSPERLMLRADWLGHGRPVLEINSWSVCDENDSHRDCHQRRVETG